ncbi:type IV secretory system conjugative DNA transfer family protein [Thermogemmatispora sp.]|uniref:type IV secretory system conjugative DNA transfer family protein n=1 Tax=Thermogemmatispora sp. TaxID=1968838 RepID=UPI002ACC0477|nr:type IV secretory system conjugative DNA transfer family protein [Thermogemmatispora sp.]
MAGPQEVTSGPGPWVFLGLALACLLITSWDTRARRQRYTYGSAGYATWRDSRAFHLTRRLFRSGLLVLFSGVGALAQRASEQPQKTNPLSREPKALSYFIIGKYHGRTIALREKEQEEHLLLTAPTGGGKSSLEIIPNLLREQGGRSLFIADLKNELYRITAGALARHHRIWWFTPSRPEQSHCYNPLAYVHSASDANMLADCWVKNTGESNDPFWSNCARFLICAIILHLRATEPDAPFCRLADLIAGKSFEEIKRDLEHSPSAEARRKAASFLSNMAYNERLVGSIMTDIGNRFQLFDSENVRAVTAQNEIDFQAMVDDPTALYLSIPRSEVPMYRPLMACFTMQMFRTWEQYAAGSPSGSLPRGIACYLDEFANIGYIPSYAHFISTARYLHISLLMVIQNFAQLDEIYGGDNAETIRANANTHLLLPGAGLRECTYYSERIGSTTVQTWTRSRKAMSWTGLNDTWTQSETQRRLLTPEEIRTLRSRTVLMLRSNLPPMLLQATPYYEEASLARLANIPYQNEHIRPELPQAIDIASIAPTIPPIESSVTGNEQASEEWHFSED